MIAGHAMATGAVLITSNARHFFRVAGLTIEILRCAGTAGCRQGRCAKCSFAAATMVNLIDSFNLIRLAAEAMAKNAIAPGSSARR